MLELGGHLDLRKTKQSIKPNTTHALDASLVRETINDIKTPIITIHDCYGVDIYTIDTTIYSINNNINKITRHLEKTSITN
jgi:hypothetical protein